MHLVPSKKLSQKTIVTKRKGKIERTSPMTLKASNRIRLSGILQLIPLLDL
jgi:hypothetical protein